MNEILNQYIQTGSPDAFRQIVEANINSVYSQCLRKLHNVALAEDVAQVVFATLAQKAAKLPADVVLEGWLFTTTRFCCSNAQRAAARRSAAERKAAAMRTEIALSPASDSAASSETEELLDDAISTLPDRDRNAVVLRFFGGRSLREVGEAMGVSEDAARQRIFRAIERLRGYFSAKGITAETATISAWLGMAVKPAGAELARSVVKLAAAKTAAGTSLSAARIFSRVAWTWPKAAAGIAASVAVTTAAVVVVSNGGTPKIPAQPRVAPIAVNPIMADVAAADAKPSDQATPVEALKKLSAAVQNNDHKAISDCVCNDGTDAAAGEMGRNFFFEQAGVWQLHKAWRTRFAEAMEVPGLNFEDFPGRGTFETMLNRMIQSGANLDAKIDGDTAEIRVPLPRDAFMDSGPNRIAALGHWSGARLVFRQIDGNWKLNTDRTFSFIGGVARQPGNTQDTTAIQAKVMAELGNGLSAVASDLQSGKIKSRDEAIQAIVAAATKAFKDAHVDGANVMTLPVIGG
jgi:RNA polymerase sigma factor (sigma-70 family)